MAAWRRAPRVAELMATSITASGTSSGAAHEVRPARELAGELVVPGDKSVSHRALLLNAIADGAARVRGLGPGADVRSTERCLQALGVAIEPDGPDARVVRGAG